MEEKAKKRRKRRGRREKEAREKSETGILMCKAKGRVRKMA